MEPVTTDNVFVARGFPRSRSEPRSRKVMKPRMISLRRGFFISLVATRGVGFGRSPLYMPKK
jgi:hypothetical protein